MTDVVNTVANTVANTVTTAATTVVTNVKTAATNEVDSLSSHWHVPVWAVIVILAVAGLAVFHFVF